MVSKYYWDSCVFIDLFQKTPARFPDIEAIIKRAETGEVEIVTSAATFTEVVKIDKAAVSVPQSDRDKIRRFFLNKYIIIYDLTRAVSHQAQDIIWAHPEINSFDAIHLASAIRAGVREFHTYDGTSKRRKKGLLDFDGMIGMPPLSISTPAGTK